MSVFTRLIYLNSSLVSFRVILLLIIVALSKSELAQVRSVCQSDIYFTHHSESEQRERSNVSNFDYYLFRGILPKIYNVDYYLDLCNYVRSKIRA